MDLKGFSTLDLKQKNDRRQVCFEYEKLLDICKYYGIITHGEEDCNLSYGLSIMPEFLREWDKIPIQGEEKIMLGDLNLS